MAVRLPSPADSYQTSGEVLQDFPNFSPACLKRQLQNLLLRWKLTCLFNSNKLINSMLNRPESGRPSHVALNFHRF